jgi:hypothetical protein
LKREEKEQIWAIYNPSEIGGGNIRSTVVTSPWITNNGLLIKRDIIAEKY